MKTSSLCAGDQLNDSQAAQACIDLLDEFGHRLQVVNEELGGRATDPWRAIILCRHGHVYPHGGCWFGASTDHRGPVARRLTALDCTTVVQDGDDGINVVFDVAHFKQVARIIRPRSKRRLSADHRRKLLAGGKQKQFNHGSEKAGAAPKRPNPHRDDSQAATAESGLKNSRHNHKVQSEKR